MSLGAKTKALLSVMLFLFVALSNSTPNYAQSIFNRNDNYDFAGEHYLARGGTSPTNFNLFISEDSSDFRRFKLHINKNQLNLSYWQAINFRVDMNNDGTWEQNWTGNETTVSYYCIGSAGNGKRTNIFKVELSRSIKIPFLFS
jgi:hypothetical protein